MRGHRWHLNLGFSDHEAVVEFKRLAAQYGKSLRKLIQGGSKASSAPNLVGVPWRGLVWRVQEAPGRVICQVGTRLRGEAPPKCQARNGQTEPPLLPRRRPLGSPSRLVGMFPAPPLMKELDRETCDYLFPVGPKRMKLTAHQCACSVD